MKLALHSSDGAGDRRRRAGFTDPSQHRGAHAAANLSATAIEAGWYHGAAIEAARQSAIEARCNPYGSERP